MSPDNTPIPPKVNDSFESNGVLRNVFIPTQLALILIGFGVTFALSK
jgi:hypothetical protein